MQIIRGTERIECVGYSRTFRWNDDPGRGFGFDCSESGILDSRLSDTALANYAFCLANPDKLTDLGIERREWSYRRPAVGQCSCGMHVELDGFTNTCERCGSDYNMSGQLLAPRRFWGEETGESASDILPIP
jgi:hypothetical protein